MATSWLTESEFADHFDELNVSLNIDPPLAFACCEASTPLRADAIIRLGLTGYEHDLVDESRVRSSTAGRSSDCLWLLSS